MADEKRVTVVIDDAVVFRKLLDGGPRTCRYCGVPAGRRFDTDPCPFCGTDPTATILNPMDRNDA